MIAKIEKTILAFLLLATFVPIITYAQGDYTLANAEEGIATTLAAADEQVPPKQARTGAGESATGKEEVIYALLNGDGTAREGYAINHFRFEGAGTLEDYGNYSAVQNLSTTAPLDLTSGTVRGDVEAGDYYYEGTLAGINLPWVISIAYTLDGKAVTSEQLAGASGKLVVHIKTAQNAKADPIFFDNYLLQIQLTLDSAKAHDVKAPDATIASVGSDKQLAFMVMPGKEGDLTLEAQVTDFEMPGIQISALPFSMSFDLPDTSALTDEAATLTDAIAQLNDGVAKLDAGVGEMSSGAADLASGSAQLSSGLAALSKNSSTMTQASQQIDGALAFISQQLAAGQIDPTQIESLIGGLSNLAVYLGQVSAGLYDASNGLNVSLGYMDGAVSMLPTIDEVALGTLMYEAGVLASTAVLSPGSKDTIDQLVASYAQAQTVAGTWAAVRPGLNDIVNGLNESAYACQTMADELNQQLLVAGPLLDESLAGIQTLAEGLGQLSASYHSFDTGLSSYTGGVDAIAANYAAFDYGLSKFVGGVKDLKAGTAELNSGTNELYINVEDLPKSIQEQVDEFLKDYQKSDFEPTSFVSEKNEKVSLVQFVLLTDAIEIEVPPATADSAAPTEQTFFDRLLALFS
jgi:X-X-X-Leu-X-X-Gly heptad repeat protein